MYYTKDHEWIDYLGVSALIGIHKNKLSGINEVLQATFCRIPSELARGEIIAEFHSERSLLQVYMPVSGSLIAINPKLLNNPSLIFNEALHSIWIAKISPAFPSLREGLLRQQQYALLTSKTAALLYE